MQRPLVLSPDVVNAYLTGYRCKGCGGLTHPLYVRYPTIKLTGSTAELLYPVFCGCGRRGRIPIRMPVLLFGYVLARTHSLEAFLRANRSQAKMFVSPGPSIMLERIVADFAAVVAAYKGGLGQVPTDLERSKFGLSETEWPEFLRRLGFGDNAELPPNP
jgi:hypothetical protein